MNKKFSTLMASMLLAGGLFNTVSAEYFADLTTADLENQFYYVKVQGGGAAANDASYNLTYDGTAVSGSTDKWIVKKVTGENGTIGYQLINPETNEPLKVTETVNGNKVEYTTFAKSSEQGGLWYITDGSTVAKGFKGSLTDASVDVNSVWQYRLDKVAPVTYTEQQLEDILDGKFAIRIGYQEDTNKNGVIEDSEWYEYSSFEGGNVFEGDIYVGGGDVTNGFELYKDADETEQIVLTSDKWESVSSALSEGFRFAIKSKSEIATATNIKGTKFLLSVPSTVKGNPIEVIAVDKDGTKHEVVVSVVNKADGAKVNRLTVGANNSLTYAEYTLTASSNVANTYVKLGASNVADMSQFANKLWNIYKNGKVLSPADGTNFINASEVYAKGAEGLWLWNGAQFVNRESDKAWTPVTLRNTDTQYEFTNGEDVYTFVAQGTPAPNGTTDGYLASLSDDQLKQNAFWIASPLSVGDTLYIAKGQNGVLEMTKDKAEAVEFRLARVAFGDKENNMQAQLQNSYLEDASKDKSNTDRVNLYQYSLVEAVSGDVLNYENNQYVLKDVSGLNESEIEALMLNNKYVFKTKGNNLYNILKGVAASYNATDKLYKVTDTYFANGTVTKLYGAFNTGRLVASENAYESVQNDLFVVVNADAQQYRGDFSNAGALDTVKIFRNDDPSYVLYEKGTLLADAKGEAIEGFLGMENVLDPQYATKQPAMLADTAKHANTYRPQYMFAVDAEYVADGWTCPLNPEHNTAAWREENGGHCADAIQDRPYMLGRYLVTLADSAQAAEKAGVKEAANKFKHEGFYRLGFVQAKHMGDSLIIASGTAAQDTIDLSKGYDLPCTFALKYVDENREAFTIETMYKKEYNTYGEYTPAANTKGYIKYQNGVPVVTTEAQAAWVFNLETLTGEENAPTANENIAAGNVVVAGINGAVVVKGAEGKNVIVSTILGKVVANEVVSSDNATIAAPAGVVVVSVDGESFKVVVK